MSTHSIRYALRATTLSAVVCFSAMASAQTAPYPSKPVTIILPYAAGTPLDAEVRIFAQKMSESLKVPFVVDFKPGAGSMIGVNYVAKSAPDGYTIAYVASSFTTSVATYPKPLFEPFKDITYLSQVLRRDLMLVASSEFPPKDFSQYVAYVKANPRKVNFATSGVGGSFHLGGAWLDAETGGESAYIHYKGAGAALIDTIAGRTDVTVSSVFDAVQNVKTGKLRPLAVLGSSRSSLLPGVPTIAEQGYPEYNYGGWAGFIGPAGMPVDVVKTLNDAMVKMVGSPEVIKRAEADGIVLLGSSPEQFEGLVEREVTRWKSIVRKYDIRPE